MASNRMGSALADMLGPCFAPLAENRRPTYIGSMPPMSTLNRIVLVLVVLIAVVQIAMLAL